MKFCRHAGVVAVFISVFFVGCGGTTAPPPSNQGGIGQGPPMGVGEKSPLMSGSAEEAEKMGRGPGRGQTPEGYKNQGVPEGPGGGPPQ